jgi:hypothetical protein
MIERTSTTVEEHRQIPVEKNWNNSQPLNRGRRIQTEPQYTGIGAAHGERYFKERRRPPRIPPPPPPSRTHHSITPHASLHSTTRQQWRRPPRRRCSSPPPSAPSPAVPGARGSSEESRAPGSSRDGGERGVTRACAWPAIGTCRAPSHQRKVRGLVPPPILMYRAPVGANAVRIALHATLACDPRACAGVLAICYATVDELPIHVFFQLLCCEMIVGFAFEREKCVFHITGAVLRPFTERVKYV